MPGQEENQNTPVIIQNELYARLTSAAKTASQWASVTSTPLAGEICLEKQPGEPPLKYKAKIGDGTTSYANLPYFGLLVDATKKTTIVRVDTVSSKKVLKFYEIALTKELDANNKETGNIIPTIGDNYLTVVAGNKMTLGDTVDDQTGHHTIAVNHDTTTRSAGTDVDLDDHDTFSIPTGFDSYGHVTEVTQYRLPDIADIATQVAEDAIKDLDVTGYAQATWSNNVLTIKGIKEVDGAISADSTKDVTINIGEYVSGVIGDLDSTVSATSGHVITGVTQTDGVLTGKTEVAYTDIAPVQDVETSDTGDSGLEVTDSSNIYNVHHKTVTQGGTDNRSVDGERETDVVTGMTVDAYGHVTGVSKDKSTHLIAADIKAPVKIENEDTWNYRQTGGTINIGENLARIPVLKGHTLVWNQLVQNGDFSDGKTLWNNGGNVDFNVTDGIGILTTTETGGGSNKTIRQSVNFIKDNFYLVRVKAKTDLSAFRVYANTSRTHMIMQPSVQNNDWNAYKWIFKSNDNDDALALTFNESDNTSGLVLNFDNINVIDLTRLFGSDTEICAALGVANLTDNANLTLAAQNFEKLFPNSYYDYCEGRLINVGGYPVKFNQLYVIPPSFTHISISQDTNGKLTFSLVSPNSDYAYRTQTIANTSGHKLYFKLKNYTSNADSLNTGVKINYAGSYINCTSDTSAILSATQNMVVNVDMRQETATGKYISAYIQIYDLTLMFGAGNEPTSVEECNKIFTKEYYPYNEGTEMNILDVMDETLAIESVGFNQWDEIAEAGNINDADGDILNDGSTRIRSKKHISVFPSQSYYFEHPGNACIACYDINKIFLGYLNISNTLAATKIFVEPQAFTMPANCYYIRFVTANTYGTTYNHDICINLSDPSRDGTYEPYKKDTLDLGWINQVGIEWNIWDEEWQVGYWSGSTGQYNPDSTSEHCTKNPIKVKPNTVYYIKNANITNDAVFFDANMNRVGSQTYVAGTNTVTTPATCMYMHVNFGLRGSTYQNDICINKSIPAFNGTYLPYGERLKVFPYGLCGGGSAYDEAQGNKVVKRFGIVDLGELEWTSSSIDGRDIWGATLIGYKHNGSNTLVQNANAEKYSQVPHNSISTDASANIFSLSGNTSYNILRVYNGSTTIKPTGKLIYELETSLTVDLEETHNLSYFVDDYGTERQLPSDTSSPVNAPFVGTFEYLSNFKDTVLDIIKKVNNYKNPVKGVNNTAQTAGKLAVYDSDKTTKSSVYSASNATIVPTGENNEVILPTVAALVAYVQQIATSPLDYQGTVASYAALPSSGTKAGDVYILSANDTTAGYQTGDWFVRNKANTGWDVIQGSISVIDGAQQIKMDGQTYTLATVEGETITMTTPDLQMTDPTASGTADNLQVITYVEQSDGQVSANKKTIPDAGTSQKGVVQLESTLINSQSTSKVPTAAQAWTELHKRNVGATEIQSFSGTITVVNGVVIGTAAPTVTPQFVGQMYIDTTNKKVYAAVGTTASTDWEVLN